MTSELTLDVLNKQRRKTALSIVVFSGMATALAWRVTWLVTAQQSFWYPVIAVVSSAIVATVFLFLGYHCYYVLSPPSQRVALSWLLLIGALVGFFLEPGQCLEWLPPKAPDWFRAYAKALPYFARATIIGCVAGLSPFCMSPTATSKRRAAVNDCLKQNSDRVSKT